MKFSVIFKINFLSLSSLLELHWWIHFLLMVFHKAHRLSSFLFILLFFFFLWKIFKRYLWDHWFSCLFKSAIEALYWIPPFNHLAPKFLGFFCMPSTSLLNFSLCSCIVFLQASLEQLFWILCQEIPVSPFLWDQLLAVYCILWWSHISLILCDLSSLV